MKKENFGHSVQSEYQVLQKGEGGIRTDLIMMDAEQACKSRAFGYPTNDIPMRRKRAKTIACSWVKTRGANTSPKGKSMNW